MTSVPHNNQCASPDSEKTLKKKEKQGIHTRKQETKLSGDGRVNTKLYVESGFDLGLFTPGQEKSTVLSINR
jgi:hypothetical protein